MKLPTLLLSLLCMSTVSAQELPPLAIQYLPVLEQEIDLRWPDAPLRSMLAAQVEQETCRSLTHSKCWSPYAELKTDREYGFGLGQITITKEFDNFLVAKKLDFTLKEWNWENRYDAEFQLRTLVLTNRFNYGKFDWILNPIHRLAFSTAAYNGGLGGTFADRRICRAMPIEDCDPDIWFDNVEHTSRKAKVAKAGYGKSFFEINREYVKNILLVRRFKYVSVLGE